MSFCSWGVHQFTNYRGFEWLLNGFWMVKWPFAAGKSIDLSSNTFTNWNEVGIAWSRLQYRRQKISKVDGNLKSLRIWQCTKQANCSQLKSGTAVSFGFKKKRFTKQQKQQPAFLMKLWKSPRAKRLGPVLCLRSRTRTSHLDFTVGILTVGIKNISAPTDPRLTKLRIAMTDPWCWLWW